MKQKENNENLPKNILNRNFISAAPLKKICTDVNFFRTTEGWLYLSLAIDLYNSKVVAYKISKHNDEKLAHKTLVQLLKLGVVGAAKTASLKTSAQAKRRENFCYSSSRMI